MAPDLPARPCDTESFPSVELVSVQKINIAGSVEKRAVCNALLSAAKRHISAFFFKSHHQALEVLKGSLVT
jgi:hypothetical protein